MSTQALASGSVVFRGLLSFEERDAGVFFGRERETKELLGLVEGSPWCVLYGASGIGKTSILQAGLFPALRAKGYFPIPIRLLLARTPGGELEAGSLMRQVREGIAREIVERGIDAALPPEGMTLWEYFHRTPFWGKRSQLVMPVLVFDQHEVLFTLGREDHGPRRDMEKFVEELRDLVENTIPEAHRRSAAESGMASFDYSRQPARVVFALREDYLADFEELYHLSPTLGQSGYRLRHLTALQALDAIRKPDPALVDPETAVRIVQVLGAPRSLAQRLAGEPDPWAWRRVVVEPVLLSLLCQELDRRRKERGSLCLAREDVTEEEADRVLRTFYEECLSDEQEPVRHFVEDSLLTDAGHRTTSALEDAPVSIGPALERLVERHFLRSLEIAGRPHLEIVHDKLVEVVRSSRDRRKEVARAAALERKRREELERLEKEKASDAERANELRKRRVFQVALGALLVILIGGMLAYRRVSASEARSKRAFEAAKKAGEEETVAKEEALTGREELSKKVDELTKVRETLEEQGRLLQRMQTVSRRAVIERVGLTRAEQHLNEGNLEQALPILVQAASLPDSTLKVRLRLIETLHVLEKGRERVRALHDMPDRITALAVSADGARVALGDAFGYLRVREAASARQVSRGYYEDGVKALWLSPDGARLLVVGRKSLRLLRLGQTLEPTLEAQFPWESGINAFDAPPGGRFAWVGDEAGGISRFDLEEPRPGVRERVASSVSGIAVSDDGTRLAIADDGRRQIKVFPLVDSGDSSFRLEADWTARVEGEDPTVALEFLPSGGLVRIGANQVSVWERSGQQVYDGGSRVRLVAGTVIADGEVIAAGDEEGKIHFIPVNAQEEIELPLDPEASPGPVVALNPFPGGLVAAWRAGGAKAFLLPSLRILSASPEELPRELPEDIALSSTPEDFWSGMNGASGDENNWISEAEAALMVAAGGGDEQRLAELIRAGFNVRAHLEDGATPLHWAAAAGHEGCIRLLVEAGADLNAPGADGSIPAHYAVRGLEERAFETLLELGSEVNWVDQSGESLLHFAAAAGYEKSVEQLLLKGARVDVQNLEGVTPLRRAAANGQEDVVRILLQRGADPELGDRLGRRPMHFAAGLGHEEVLELLLTGRADAQCRTEMGWTPLHFAAREGRPGSVRLLVEAGQVPLDLLNGEDGMTPLALAAWAPEGEAKHAEVAQYLLTRGANPLVGDRDGDTPVHAAVWGQSLDLLRQFARTPGAFSVRSHEGQTPLHIAITQRWQEGIDFLLERVPQEAIDLPASRGHTPLIDALVARDYEVVRVLLEKGADATLADEDDDTALNYAVIRDTPRWVFESLLAAPRVDPKRPNFVGRTPFHHAVRHGNLELARLLYEREPRLLDLRDTSGATPLLLAVSDEHEDIARWLLERGADPAAYDSKRQCVLAWALENRLDGLARELIRRAGVDLDFADADGMTPLLLALLSKNSELASELVSAGADVRKGSLRGDTPLHLALNASLAEAMLKGGADPNARTDAASTPLMTAAMFGRPEVVRILLAGGAGVVESDRDGDTVLHLACMAGEREVLQELLRVEPGPDLDAQNKEGRTALMFSAMRGEEEDVESIDLLLASGAATRPRDLTKFTALHYAANSGTHGVVARLALGRDELDSPGGEKSMTPLHVAAKCDDSDEVAAAKVRALLEAGAAHDSRDSDGQTPLHYAAHLDRRAVAEALLIGGADRGIRDGEDKTPDELAPPALKAFLRAWKRR